jgi:hypothetical protein
MKNLYISIGNSDDKLTQKEWSSFAIDTAGAVRKWGSQLHGEWLSLPHAQFQNACWCLEILEDDMDGLRGELARLATQYQQDAIAWAEATFFEITPIEAPEIG